MQASPRLLLNRTVMVRLAKGHETMTTDDVKEQIRTVAVGAWEAVPRQRRKSRPEGQAYGIMVADGLRDSTHLIIFLLLLFRVLGTFHAFQLMQCQA